MQRLSLAPPSLQFHGVVDALRRLPVLQGPTALWRGNGANILRIVPNGAIKFALFERTRDLLTHFSGANRVQWSHRLAAGAISGGASLVVLYPLDCARTLVAADWSGRGEPRLCPGVLSWLRRTVADDGLLSLFRGMGASVLGIVPYQAIAFTTYDTLKQYLPPPANGNGNGNGNGIGIGNGNGNGIGGGSSGPRLAAATAAAVLAQTVTYPFDTVRRRLQVNGRPGYKRGYSGTVDAVVQMARREGARSFFSGVGVNALRAVPGTALQFVLYDHLKELVLPNAR